MLDGVSGAAAHISFSRWQQSLLATVDLSSGCLECSLAVKWIQHSIDNVCSPITRCVFGPLVNGYGDTQPCYNVQSWQGNMGDYCIVHAFARLADTHLEGRAAA